MGSRITLKKAWLIRWCYTGKDEDALLEQYGIKNKIIDFLSNRKSFEDCVEYVKSLYGIKMLSFSERAPLEDYTYGKKNKKEMFEVKVPVWTHKQSDLYGDLERSLASHKRGSNKYKDLLEQCQNFPKFVVVGNNPSIECREVYNLTIFHDEDGSEVLEWEELLADGTKEKERCEVKAKF